MSTTKTTPPPDYTSIGRICAMLQHDPRQIAHAARCAGVPVALKLNGVDHFDADGVEKIAAWFRTRESRD